MRDAFSQQQDSVSVRFEQVPTTASQNLLEIDAFCYCSSTPTECSAVSTNVPRREICPKGYQPVQRNVMPSASCFNTVTRPLPPASGPWQNAFNWREGPFRITYDRREGLSDTYIEAVEKQICACNSRETHRSFYSSVHQRCFGVEPTTVTESFIGTIEQFENPNGEQVSCELLPDELARREAAYQACVMEKMSESQLGTDTLQPEPEVWEPSIGVGYSSSPETGSIATPTVSVELSVQLQE